MNEVLADVELPFCLVFSLRFLFSLPPVCFRVCWSINIPPPRPTFHMCEFTAYEMAPNVCAMTLEYVKSGVIINVFSKLAFTKMWSLNLSLCRSFGQNGCANGTCGVCSLLF